MRGIRPLLPALAAVALVAGFAVPVSAQTDAFYAGKTLKILVGVEAGGTVDTMARLFVGYLRKHIPGNPAVVVQNMPSAAGVGPRISSTRTRRRTG